MSRPMPHHRDELSDIALQLLPIRQSGGDVGERPEGDEFDLAWSVAERLNHRTDAVVRGGHATTEVKANVAHAVFAMHHLGRLERARQWLGGTGVHGYFGTTSLTKRSLLWIFHALPCGIHEMTC